MLYRLAMKAPSAPPAVDPDLSADDLALVDGGFWNADLWRLKHGQITQDQYDWLQEYYEDNDIVF